jgi:hypothetical protein
MSAANGVSAESGGAAGSTHPPGLPSWIDAGHDLLTKDSGALLRDAEYEYAYRFARCGSDT